MSLRLGLTGTSPAGLEVRTVHTNPAGTGPGMSEGTVIIIGEYQISMIDFLIMADYVLTNTDLMQDNDPRLQFIKCVRSMSVVGGHNKGNKRLDTDVHPAIP